MAPNTTKAPLPSAQPKAVLFVGADSTTLTTAFAETAHRYRCEHAPSVERAIEIARHGQPDLVIVAGDAAEVAHAVEALTDHPATGGACFVAWSADVSGRDVARLNSLGARVALASPESLRRASEEALAERATALARATREAEAAACAVDLGGTRVVVADDDPAIVWFFADVLRAAGCAVAEASDGDVALDAARRMEPDVVLSDIRMPRLDGVRLCGALHADPLLADVPVVLLSWRQDWLPEACRNARASAALVKHATPEQVLSCVRASLAAHAKLARRLREPGAARGRLETITPYRVLRAVCDARRDARVTFREPTHFYEVRIRDGAPRTATRVAHDRSVLRGEEALWASLEVRAGRFAVIAERAPVERELSGTLHEQIAPHVALARSRVGSVAAGDASRTIPIRLAPRIDAAASFELPRLPASLVDLPVRTVPMRQRPLRRESTHRLTLPQAPAARARTKRVAAAPRRSSWAGVLRALVAATALIGLALVGGLGAPPPPTPAPTAGPVAQGPNDGARRPDRFGADAGALTPSPAIRASRTAPGRPR